MKVKRIIYSRLVSLGNYENEKIEIELEVESGETASEVLEKAKKFVDLKLEKSKYTSYQIENAKKVLADKDNHTLNQIKEAEKILNYYEDEHELPF